MLLRVSLELLLLSPCRFSLSLAHLVTDRCVSDRDFMRSLLCSPILLDWYTFNYGTVRRALITSL